MNAPFTWLDDPKRKVIIYGAGVLGTELFKLLIDASFDKGDILCFFDSNPAKNNTTLHGVPVVSPTADYAKSNPVVLLAQERGGQLALMRNVCRDLGLETIDYARVRNIAAESAWTFAARRPSSGDLLYMDLVDSCNLSCRNCPRTFRNPENAAGNVMTRQTFDRILDKAAETGFTRIAPFNWTEPFLHPEIRRFAHECAKRGLTLVISTNLSLPQIPDLIPTLKYCDQLLVTVSGFTREMHGRNHRRSDIDVVKNHLETIAGAKRRHEIDAHVSVKFLNFEYNVPEIELFEEYASGLGLGFFVEHGVVRTPCRPDYDSAMKSLFSGMMDDYAELRKRTLMDKCLYRDTSMTLDYRGDVYLCCTCVNIPFFKIGNFLEDDFNLLQALRQTHPFCAVCGMEWSGPASAGSGE